MPNPTLASQSEAARGAIPAGSGAVRATAADRPHTGERFELTARDGQVLAAAQFAPNPGAGGNAPAIVIAAATGVPQGFYRALARWFAERGHAVYTFDYRGTGASRPRRLRGFAADFGDWVADIDAMLVHALARHARVSLLGHSSGGFLAPAAPQATRLHRLVLVGSQTAYWRDWPALQRWPMALLWHGLMPAITAFVGYFPGRTLRLGEDLPRGIAMQWASRPWRDPFERAEMASGYARTLPPLHLAAATDDPFATPAALERLKARLAHVPLHCHAVAPADAGLNKLGHFTALRPEAAAWWPQLRVWLCGESVAPAAFESQARGTTA